VCAHASISAHILSLTVPHTPDTDVEQAVCTLHDEVGQGLAACFAFIAAIDPLEVVLSAVMSLPQVFHCGTDLLLVSLDSTRVCLLFTMDDLFRPSEKSLLGPLIAGTGLPAFATGIAEFGFAETACHWLELEEEGTEGSELTSCDCIQCRAQ
jgi:hypothetical protein